MGGVIGLAIVNDRPGQFRQVQAFRIVVTKPDPINFHNHQRLQHFFSPEVQLAVKKVFFTDGFNIQMRNTSRIRSGANPIFVNDVAEEADSRLGNQSVV